MHSYFLTPVQMFDKYLLYWLCLLRPVASIFCCVLCVLYSHSIVNSESLLTSQPLDLVVLNSKHRIFLVIAIQYSILLLTRPPSAKIQSFDVI
jgi:hypothetical protein